MATCRCGRVGKKNRRRGWKCRKCRNETAPAAPKPVYKGQKGR